MDNARKVLQGAFKLNVAQDQVEHQRALEIERNCESRSLALPAIMELSRTLKRIGTWKAEAGRCPTASLVIDARDVRAEGAPRMESVTALSASWKEQHRGVTKGAVVRAPPRPETECFRVGMCVCSNTQQGRATGTGSFWQSTQKGLKQSPGVTKDRLKDANMVLMWSARNKASVTIRVVFIAVRYFRPWRPTFLEIRAALPFE